MAKAQFHRNQKVWVESVGAWATVERIAPIWAKGFDEPVKITYDVGLGREFAANELRAEERADETNIAAADHWRLMRARNKWQQPADCGHHPYPGTFPVVVTDRADWGGWRVPGSEYDRDPHRIEFQARLIAAAPRLLAMAKTLAALVDEGAEEAPPELQALAGQAAALLRDMEEIPAAPQPRPNAVPAAAE